jgi:hypothetical protein
LSYFNGNIRGVQAISNIDFICDSNAHFPSLKFVNSRFENNIFNINFQMTGKDACVRSNNGGQWTPLLRQLHVKENGGVLGADFSMFAKRIRGKVSCSGDCDIFLLSSQDYLNV